MAKKSKKKASKKKAAASTTEKVTAKNVTHVKGKENVVKDVMVEAPADPEQEPAAAPAIQEERTLKHVGKGGRVRYLTQSEYDKEFN